MQVTAKLNHLRISPRKVRLVTDLIKGLSVKEAKTQLRFAIKKSASPILKLLDSAISNAKHNFNLDEDNLYIAKLTVDGGPSLKRWMPRAMGRATPILKRTSHISLVLEEKVPSYVKPKIKEKLKPEEEKLEAKPPVEKIETEEKIFTAVPEQFEKLETKPVVPKRPYGASSDAKRRFFSRQTFGNIKKIFRRKSV